ncbi:MAG: beta-ketoacyl synthase N-terminal-like domain-containing protein [Phycisphaeraceae bacterium]
MARRVLITGLGPITGLGIGIDANWQAMLLGRSAIAPIQAFDASAFPCTLGAEVKDFKVQAYVPKSYRKAIKVMARDIELAVAAADLAARDAGLVTKGTLSEEGATTYPPRRFGANIGAGLIAADLDELTGALVEARDDHGQFDFAKWGAQGMGHLTPLWLLKYLPNMLACHVTIIHDAQGPSNTITCAEASASLSIGEALRVIQRGDADASFCGGAESKLNPMAYLRRILNGGLNITSNPPEGDPAKAVRPFCATAAGTVVGEGGGLVILEAAETFEQRKASSGDGTPPRAYAAVLGFGASQSIHPQARNLKPDPQGKGVALAISAALRDAGVSPDAIDLIVPLGSGVAEFDQAEAAALRQVFSTRLAQVPVVSLVPMVGNCGAGMGGIGAAIAAKTLAEQTLPATLNCDQPLPGLRAATAPSRPAELRHVLTYTTGLGGQNAALVLGRA